MKNFVMKVYIGQELRPDELGVWWFVRIPDQKWKYFNIKIERVLIELKKRLEVKEKTDVNNHYYCCHQEGDCYVKAEPTPEPCKHIWNTHSGNKGSWEECRVCNEVREPKSKVPEKFSKNYIWETPKHATTDALEKINEIISYLKEKEDNE